MSTKKNKTNKTKDKHKKNKQMKDNQCTTKKEVWCATLAKVETEHGNTKEKAKAKADLKGNAGTAEKLDTGAGTVG